ncbi:TnsD family Tn7-like transposition protein [Clostridium neonatale]|uniref:TnsD family Tn7-like transposition protein n=1 Tax=Clostridium neonatale TaxID=137838 RepID=UPI001B373A4F|nr:TnsD family Tn7-like transposition protein [Clostridium neonatale]MBP8311982.1 TniQ family protein [Clostridium neonatale]CAI3538468.1 TnsD domain-containing protein [Clostridium neonatale]CAI3552748.1 TnsD domain-containing protein [Clostridium neonatale]CAI3579940.1 TnsD domain-containing protein [Clostridium neonatale]CAI3586497.1 TnsD domain-containing protein [Clostridium neonatale]
MSLFFPEPYEDEILYSVISRYHYYIGNTNVKNTFKELFGNINKVPTIELGGNITEICKLINNPKYNEEYLIWNHTNLPFYYPFLNISNQNKIIEMMKRNNAQGIYAKIGIVAGGICRKKDLYYCPECAKADLKNIGETYFHRVHQIPGVKVCPEHHCLLEKYMEGTYNKKRINFLRISIKDLKLNPKYEKDSEINNVLIIVAESCQYILNNNIKNINYNDIMQRYKEILKDKEFLTVNKRVRQKKLILYLNEYYSNKILNIFDSKLNDKESNWLKIMLRNSKEFVHPIRHILFIICIYTDIKSFINFKENNSKYIWPCLNKICKYYKENIITDIIITSDYKSRKPVGTAECPYCGFKYSRKIMDNNRINEFGRVKDFGHLWCEKLIEILESKQYNVSNIAKIMGCDYKTVVRYAGILGKRDLIDSKITFTKNVQIIKDKSYELQYLQDILKYKKYHFKSTRTDIRKALNKQYAWLYKNNKKWLFDNLPKSNNNYICRINDRVNWNKRDEEILLKIKKNYVKIMKSDEKIRITKSMFGRFLGISALLDHNLDKMPKTEKYLLAINESIEQYQERRVKKICRHFFKERITIRRWKIMRIAGLKNNCSSKAIKIINYYINKQLNQRI